jgi:hypothetical protein
MSNNHGELTKDILVSKLDERLLGWEFGDIERASLIGEAKLAGFILGACFIDAMAGFYAGLTKDQVRRGSPDRFMNFVEKYLSQYDPEKLYNDLRCGLVHSYAEGGTYVFTDANKCGKHFSVTSSGKVLLNLEDFAHDLEEAYKKFRNDMLTDNEVFDRAKRRYLSMGLMDLVSIN